jgi:cardiolipin synthase
VFEDAARDGVDVRLLVPGASDLPMIRNISRTGYRRLLRAGIRIWEWQGPMLHAKTVEIDGRWLRVGSTNLNPSSLVANWEVDLFMDHPGLVEEMSRRFTTDLARSAEVVSRVRRFAPELPGFGRATALVASRPELSERVGRHRPGLRERKRRAFQHAAGLSRAANAALIGPVLLIMVVMATVLLLFPVIAAYVTAGILLMLATFLALKSLVRRPRD